MVSSSSSAISGVDLTRRGALVLLLGGVLGCPRAEVGSLPETATVEPTVRIGLGLPAGERSIGGGSGALVVTGPDGGGITLVPAGTTGAAAAVGPLVSIRIGGIATPAARTISIRAVDPNGTVRVDGRDYRGSVAISATPTGLLVVNELALEDYVAGVVNAEMGRRPPTDQQAVMAQAVVSRTVAARALGRYRVRGYDLLATVADQVYGGTGTETELGRAAVDATRGQVLTSAGVIIEAFFHSTCGGRTEAVDDVFSGAPQSFLRSVSDRDPGGTAYCAISPRFRWREEWDAETTARLLRATARTATGAAAVPTDLQISRRSPSGRAAELQVVAAGHATPVTGQNAIRQLLRLPDGGWLRSTQFSLQVTRAGGRISRVVAEGGGNGHGVGMCQWGAVGRARAGFSYREILSAYFPGADISRLY